MKQTPGATAGATSSGLACETCGRPDAVKMDDRWLCPDCVAIAGSCCPEFGAWDLWSTPAPTEESPS